MRRLLAPLVAALAVVLTLLASAPPAAAAPGGEAAEAVQGRLLYDDEGERKPVAEVEISVAATGGDDVGSVTTDEEGRWRVDLPGPGDYEVTIDADSLPDEVELRDEDRATLAVSIRPQQVRTVLFALGNDPRQVGSRFDEFLQLLVEGVKFGLIIAITAVGLSLIFGTTGLVNFAHGELVTFGAMIAYIFNRILGWNLILATVGAMVVSALFGLGLDAAVWRPLRRRRTGLIAMMVVSIGLGLVGRYVYLYQFGGRTRPYGDYNLQRAVDIGPVSVAPKDLVMMAISLAVLAAVGLALQFTRIGKAMRAVADNPDLAESSGIDVDRVIQVVWMAGAALACLGGVFFGLSEQVSFQMGFQLLLLMFAGVTLGGLGTAYGALVGSFLIGLLVQVSTLWVPTELKNVGALSVLIIVLLLRPQGILGRAERIG